VTPKVGAASCAQTTSSALWGPNAVVPIAAAPINTATPHLAARVAARTTQPPAEVLASTHAANQARSAAPKAMTAAFAVPAGRAVATTPVGLSRISAAPRESGVARTATPAARLAPRVPASAPTASAVIVAGKASSAQRGTNAATGSLKTIPTT
jgi:hypothetical protein